MGGTDNTTVLVFHVIGWEGSASLCDQWTSHVIPNNLRNSPEYLYYAIVVQLLFIDDTEL